MVFCSVIWASPSTWMEQLGNINCILLRRSAQKPTGDRNDGWNSGDWGVTVTDGQ